ncbi:MAG: hypothetical protein A2Z25_08875 [Planctomycetes bacterium RBG_16_55_9]|nr:MAG: hypothetical protein A2Z25_08875 [Planctomycetes bacterium RBG_16_55_9]
MGTPTTIFIDTSIFDESAYNFNSASFKAFRSLVKSLKLKLLMPDPTAREIRRHISERSHTAVKSIQDAARRAPFLSQLDDWPLNKTTENALVFDLIGHVEKQSADFYAIFEVHTLDYAGINIVEIMNWYDWEQAPFSDRKKSEFPDAFCVAILNEYHKATSENIAVISRDGDFKSACEKYKHLLYFPSLASYAEALQREDERVDRIHELLSKDDSIVRKSISEQFQDLSFFIEANWEGDAEDIEVTDFDELEYHVVGIGDHSYIISFTAEISFSAYVSYWDLETATYDEGDVIPWHKIEGLVETTTSVSGTLKIATDEKERAIIECHSTEFDQDSIEIDTKPDEVSGDTILN